MDSLARHTGLRCSAQVSVALGPQAKVHPYGLCHPGGKATLKRILAQAINCQQSGPPPKLHIPSLEGPTNQQKGLIAHGNAWDNDRGHLAGWMVSTAH
ncbi:hypothetical protein L0F63_003735 [Massospora cicadina]|nr:hypothetical protein L0F63_003735 [Massospora cicadina]